MGATGNNKSAITACGGDGGSVMTDRQGRPVVSKLLRAGEPHTCRLRYHM